MDEKRQRGSRYRIHPTLIKISTNEKVDSELLFGCMGYRRLSSTSVGCSGFSVSNENRQSEVVICSIFPFLPLLQSFPSTSIPLNSSIPSSPISRREEIESNKLRMWTERISDLCKTLPLTVKVLQQHHLKEEAVTADSHEWKEASIIRFVFISSTAKTVEQLTQSSASQWYCGWKPPSSSALFSTDLLMASMSCFAILSLSKNESIMDHNISLSSIPLFSVDDDIHQKIVREKPPIGERVKMIGAPYGILSPRMFCFSQTSGVICNRSRDDGLLIADCQTLPGMEGSPIFSLSEQKDSHVLEFDDLIAVCCPPLRRMDESIVLSFAVPWPSLHQTLCDQLDLHFLSAFPPLLTTSSSLNSPIIISAAPVVAQTAAKKSVRLHYGPSISESFHLPMERKRKDISKAVRRAREAVVIISSNGMWGSGVVCSSEGHIITNAHVVASARGQLQEPFDRRQRRWEESTVRVKLPRFFDEKSTNLHRQSHYNKWVSASIILISASCLDIALLHAPALHSQSWWQLPSRLGFPRAALFQRHFSSQEFLPKHQTDRRREDDKEGEEEEEEENDDKEEEEEEEEGRGGRGGKGHSVIQGELVIGVGFGVFGSNADLQVGCTTGVVSKLIVSSLKPTDDDRYPSNALIQTDTAIHKGNSGGALIDIDSRLLGIPSFNILHRSLHGITRTIPKFNFSVPVEWLIPVGKLINQRIPSSAATEECLRALESSHDFLVGFWKLQPELFLPLSKSLQSQHLDQVLIDSLKNSSDQPRSKL